MEQATNQFNKGLQMDTHPMVQGNDSLTDCLNGTLITMNGNEVVLQNDMGNRRVDNAFLPAGYEPVGIKEYGGIIYVAAYNPITNRSQIGSFPSPERKISPDDIKSGLKGTFDFSSLEDHYTSSNLSIECLKQDTILVPLTSDNVLHAGDKFVVYASDLSSLASEITNYRNIANKKIASPKNKLYTLALGILNSQNEFVDITKTLCRWNEQNRINSYTNESDLYKFNDGYFIASSLPNIPTPDYTKSDKELLKERQVITANTYSYKLIGPLYLKATLNHIQDFNYNVYGVKNGSNADLYVEGFITYNCPDWINTEENQTESDIYDSYELGTISNGWFDLKGITQENGGTSSIVNSGEKISYDPNTNLYTVKVIKKYTKVKPKSNTTLIDYTVAVRCNSKISDIYLENLSSSGVIDISKLGSGDVTLTGWRFFNANNVTTLVYSFDAYPIYGSEFTNLKFKFINVQDSSDNFTLEGYQIYNGRVTININWGAYNIQPRKLYKVQITGDKSENQQFNFVRWFLSTPLMNDCFTPNSSNFVQDYGNDSSEKVDAKLKVSLTADLQAIDHSETQYAETYNRDNNAGWIRKKTIGDDNVLHTEFEHKYQINFNVSPVTKIINNNYYPDFITINSQGTIQVQTTLNPFDVESIQTFKDTQDLKLENFVEAGAISSTNSHIQGVIKFYDKFKSKGDNTKTITNPFGQVDEWLKYSIFNLNGSSLSTNLPKYGGIGLDCNSETGSDDWHYVNIYYSGDDHVQMIRGNGDPPTSGGERIASKREEDPVIFTYNNLKDSIRSIFNDISKVPAKSLFLYVYQNTNDGDEKWTNKMSNSSSRSTYNTTLKNNARVWWRTAGGDWAMFKQTKYSTTPLWDFIKANVFNNSIDNLYYCFSENITCERAGLIVPDSSQYNFNYPYELSSNLNIQGTFTTNPTIRSNYNVQCQNEGVNTPNNIKFSMNDTINTGELNVNIILKSLDKFEDEVSDKVNSTLDCIDIVNGLDKDLDGNKLNINKFYMFKNGKLEPKTLDNIQITSDYTANPGYRGILCTTSTKGTPNWRYDCMGDDDDDWTVMDYNNILIV